MPKPERLIEMYVGYHTGDSGGHWELLDVMVPAAMPKAEAVVLAGQKLAERLFEQPAAFWGVYCYWTDEMMIEMDEEE
ncbi:MAG: hypothetical protein KA773_23260 [Chloroflexi bacterium]|nr:hypothetical protein [Chloroflexota bacterium]